MAAPYLSPTKIGKVRTAARFCSHAERDSVRHSSIARFTSTCGSCAGTFALPDYVKGQNIR